MSRKSFELPGIAMFSLISCERLIAEDPGFEVASISGCIGNRASMSMLVIQLRETMTYTLEKGNGRGSRRKTMSMLVVRL